MTIGVPQTIDYVGTNITFAAISAFEFPSANSRRFLWVKNGGGVSTTVTVVIPGTTFEQANPDVAVAIPAGQERMIGPLSPEIADGNGLVAVTVSAITSVTVAQVTLDTPPPDLPT